MTLQVVQTGIEGLTIELQPMFGTLEGAVFHMLPGGTSNPEGLGGEILDVYAFSAKGFGVPRGGHYHLKLDELFFTVSGTALWLFSDFRGGSPTKGQTVGVIVGAGRPEETHGLPAFVLEDGSLPRVRVPAGVYHVLFPLTDARVTTVALGSTPYDKEDYRYPDLKDIPGASAILEKFHLHSAKN